VTCHCNGRPVDLLVIFSYVAAVSSSSRGGEMVKRKLIALAALLALAVVFAACGDNSSSSSSGSGSGSDSAQGAPSGKREKLRIVVANAGVAGDPFSTPIENGAKQAGEDLGVDVDYQSTQTIDFPGQAKLIRAAAATKPDGIISSDIDGRVLNPPLRAATDAGIAVFLITGGGEFQRDTGAIGYWELDQARVGGDSGERMKAMGVRNALCVNQGIGIPGLDLRCSSFKEAFAPGTVKVVGVPADDPTATKNRVKAALQSDSTIDAIFTVGNTPALPSLNAVQELGLEDRVTIGAVDPNAGILEAVRDGDIAFVADQQQFLHGYEAVKSIVLYKRYGLTPTSIAQGPGYVTRENAASIIELAKQGLR
jgi:simple sugar transport system substrate-binding protein